jgi:hypothetical protein
VRQVVYKLTVMVVSSCTVTKSVTRLARVIDVVCVVVTVEVGVADVRLRQLHAVETTSQAKYTTAAGAVEHDGPGCALEMGVEESVGVIDGVLEKLLDSLADGVGVGVLEAILNELLETTLLESSLLGATLLEATLLDSSLLESTMLLDDRMSLDAATLLDADTLKLPDMLRISLLDMLVRELLESFEVVSSFEVDVARELLVFHGSLTYTTDDVGEGLGLCFDDGLALCFEDGLTSCFEDGFACPQPRLSKAGHALRVLDACSYEGCEVDWHGDVEVAWGCPLKASPRGSTAWDVH